MGLNLLRPVIYQLKLFNFMMQLRKAKRQKAKLRIGFSGPSGSGKTYSALLLASGITSWDKIALIDTENGRGDFYADLGEYNILRLSAPFTPERYIQAIEECEKSGMEVIIIDSTSHEWEGKGGCLESNELIAQAKFKGNSWAAWSVTTPKHQSFIEKIVMSPCHIFTTARSKTETIQEGGKVKKLGMKDIQREGFEYEFTVYFNLDRDGNYATAGKDNTQLFKDNIPFKITKETGESLSNWANSGSEPIPFEPSRDTIKPDPRRDLLDALNALPTVNNEKEAVEFLNKTIGTKFTSIVSLTDDQATRALEKFNNLSK